MTSEELAQAVEGIVTSTKARILTVGDQQYSDGDKQHFETMTFGDLIDWAVEEVDDTIVYAAMLRIRLARLKDAIATK